MGVYRRVRAKGRIVYRVGTWFEGKTHFETVGTDRRVAHRINKQRKREVAAGTYVPKREASGSTTIFDYSVDWLVSRGNRTKKDDAQRMRDHILPHVGTIKLEDLTRKQVIALVKALVAEDQTMSIKTAKNAFGVFRTMMQEAFESQIITHDPCGRLPRGTWPSDAAAGSKGKKRREIYPKDEVVRLTTSALLPPAVVVMNNIYFYTCAREGEGCGLTWRQWTRDSLPLGALAIDWQYDHKPLKQDEQPRRVPVHPVLAEILEWWWREGFALTYGRGPTLDDFIVPRLAPGRWNKLRTLGAKSDCHTKSSAYKAFTRACAKVGIECRSLHSTRHTGITAARRGFQSDRLKAPLERITHNSKGEIIDCYTQWEWEPLCEAILAISYAPTVPAKEPMTPSNGAAPGTARTIPRDTEFAQEFAQSQTVREMIEENCGGAGNRTRRTTHDPARKSTNPLITLPSDALSDSRQIVQVDAGLAAGQSPVADAARNYLAAGSRGEPCADLALQMASAVMSSARVRLALGVLAGDEHLHSRATELAGLVLSDSPTAHDATRKAGAR